VKNMPKIDAEAHAIPATETAEKRLGQKLYANMIMLGALTKITSIVDDNAIEKAITETIPKNVLALNLQAYRIGKGLAK